MDRAAPGIRQRPGSPTSLDAVTARSNRSKSDQDPSTWMPPSGEVHCQYDAEWTATKLRWDLTLDPQEQTELLHLAEECPTIQVPLRTSPVAETPAPPAWAQVT
ncbi:hypothetical protein [Streptomyces sp. ISL-98]|uniref:hypothetical protein n=1 Tax=Streptomyces sp. ISL-98 TaxID=2819192 RepID=UPI0035B091DB